MKKIDKNHDAAADDDDADDAANIIRDGHNVRRVDIADEEAGGNSQL